MSPCKRLPPSSKRRRHLQLRDLAFQVSQQRGGPRSAQSAPLPPTHGDFRFGLRSEPQSLREPPPLPALPAGTAPARSSEGLEEEGLLGRGPRAPRGGRASPSHDVRGPRRPLPSPGAASPPPTAAGGSPRSRAPPRPARPGPAAASDEPGTQEPQLRGDGGAGPAEDDPAEAGVEEGGGSRRRTAYPGSADAG